MRKSQPINKHPVSQVIRLTRPDVKPKGIIKSHPWEVAFTYNALISKVFNKMQANNTSVVSMKQLSINPSSIISARKQPISSAELKILVSLEQTRGHEVSFVCVKEHEDDKSTYEIIIHKPEGAFKC